MSKAYLQWKKGSKIFTLGGSVDKFVSILKGDRQDTGKLVYSTARTDQQDIAFSRKFGRVRTCDSNGLVDDRRVNNPEIASMFAYLGGGGKRAMW